MVEKTVLHSLNAGMVLDRTIFVGLSAPDLSQTIQSIRAAGAKPLYVVDSADTLFGKASLISLIHTNSPLAGVVNEALGGFFTEAQLEALTQAQAIKPLVANQEAIGQHEEQGNGDVIVNLAKAPAAGYIFAVVPQGWSISNNMSLGATKIKRKVKNTDGDGTMFFMSPAEFERLWLFASKAWSGHPDAPLQAKFQTGVGPCMAKVQDDRIALKGNYIRRYEIEQVAKYRGWAMPAAAKQAA